MNSSPVCQECKTPVSTVPTVMEYQGEEIYLFDPTVCQSCLRKLCERYSTQCANCGGCIPPYSNVGILKGNSGQKQLIHMTTSCTTPGSAFYGYWGKGEIKDFVEIEACS
ncbi:MAG: hypothetical protein F3741_01520 [Nitrospinae bacterium]|nr:hypothetical protein [Nitrospinota bacterium]